PLARLSCLAFGSLLYLPNAVSTNSQMINRTNKTAIVYLLLDARFRDLLLQLPTALGAEPVAPGGRALATVATQVVVRVFGIYFAVYHPQVHRTFASFLGLMELAV
ncbi:MAG: hypothetical protein J7M34_05795, partial [Anaerolineae bacterium]|nr:hypothetical protein [Anaerolineae bacterium]